MSKARRGRPRATPIEVQRRRILDAGREAFAENGYESTVVATIAERAGETRASIYELFADKEGLFAAVAHDVADTVLSAFDTALEAGPADPSTSLEATIRGNVVWILELFSQRPAMVAIIRECARVSRGDADDPAARARRRIEDRLTQLHQDRAAAYGQELGESARALSVLILTMVEGMASRAATEPAWSDQETLDLISEFAVGGYLRLVRPESKTLGVFDQAAAQGPTG